MDRFDAVLVAFLVVLGLMMKFPEQYRRGMARLCSIEQERFPPYPRQAAIAIFVFFGLILLLDLLRQLGWR